MPIITTGNTPQPSHLPAGTPTSIAVSPLAGRATLFVGGQAQPDLDALTVRWGAEERLNTPAVLELVLQNWGAVGAGVGLRFDDRRVLDLGKWLQLRSGSTVVFDGAIVALGAEFPAGEPPRARVVAVDRLQSLAHTVRSRDFNQVDDAAMLRQIAGDHGLQCDANLSGPTFRYVSQRACSDLDFLRQRAEAGDFHVRAVGSGLVARRLGSADGPVPSFTLGRDLLGFSVTADLRGQTTRLMVSGWDPTAKQPLAATGVLSSAELDVAGGADAATLLQRCPDLSSPGVRPSNAGNAAEAAALAHALAAARARRFVIGNGRLAGLAETLHVGSSVQLLGLGRLHSGSYHVSLLHRGLDPQQGQYTDIEVQRNAIGNV